MEPEFKCVRCGCCCKWPGYVLVKDREIEVIAGLLGLEVYEFTSRYTVITADRGGLSLAEKKDGSCVFYQELPPGCKIEAVKPEQCRDFPQKWQTADWRERCAGAALLQKEDGN